MTSMENVSATSPINPHFFQPLLPGFHSHLNIPIAFYSKHIEGKSNNGNAMVKLRSDASDIKWVVKMDGRKLTQGWQNFATSHDLRIGDIVIFRHDGDFLFNVTCFGPSCCELQYDDVDDVIQISSDSDVESKYQYTREAGSSSDHSSFYGRVTSWGLSKDMLFLPSDFSRSNGLMNRKCEIILLNEDGEPWTLFLTYHKSRCGVYIRSGWRNFCRANRKIANDLLTFKLVQAGRKPVLQLCSSVYNQECLQASSSSSSTNQYRFLTLTFTPYSLKKCKLCIPGRFVKANGIQNERMITLVDRYGMETTTSLKPEEKYGKLRIGKGWREFCEVNGVKTGESFKLELIKEEEEDTTTHLLKFCSKV